jgi:hypothetical protein
LPRAKAILFSILAALLLSAAVVNALGRFGGAGQRPDDAADAAELPTRLHNRLAVTSEPGEGEKFKTYLGAAEIYNRRLSDGATSFELYVAYWKKGRSELRHAYGHIPDVCWSMGGWRCDDGRSAQVYEVGGVPLKPAEWRRFSAGGRSLEVIYWCLIGDEVFPYRYDPAEAIRAGARRESDEPKRGPTATRWYEQSVFLTLWRRMLFGGGVDDAPRGDTVPASTYFIRINSEQSIATLVFNPMFREQIRLLSRLGLAASRTGAVGAEATK